MKKIILPVVALGAALIGGAALAQPYGYYGGRHYDRDYGYDHRYVRRGYRDSDRDGRPDHVEWNRDRDRDGRPDQWDRRDNRRHRYHGHRTYHRAYERPYYGYGYGYRY